jgi:hypothetical protein
MKLHPAWLAPLVAALFLGAVFAGRAWELPTMQQRFSETPSQTKNVDLIVEGLRCRGTSAFLVKRLEGLPGIVTLETYVQEHRAAIGYDPGQISLERIQAAIEEPVLLNDGRKVQAFTVTEIRE